MENRIIALVAEHLLNEQFRSKKQMANALGLQYRTLLNACSGKCSSRCYEKVLNATLRYRHDLTRIQERLPESRIIGTSEDIADWNAGKIAVGLLQPASGGHGLNLQEGGSTIVWYGLTWSLELYQQLNARLWRQGQKNSTVVIHHIVTAGTHDEDVLRALERKDMGQAALIRAVRAQIGGTI